MKKEQSPTNTFTSIFKQLKTNFQPNKTNNYETTEVVHDIFQKKTTVS